MPESSIGERCAICQQPSTTLVRIESPKSQNRPSVAWTVTLCDEHGVKVMEMVTDYYADEAIKHERTPERFGRDEEGER